jgi:putative hemolysin
MIPTAATRDSRLAPPCPEGRPVDWTFDVGWAGCEADVRAAQRLRYRIFAGDLGACLPPDAVAQQLDVDRFDPYCDHLLVWARDLSELQPRRLVGTYRVLGPAGARRAGGLYADGEFDLSALDVLRAGAVELGRACVHPDWRSGGVILSLWSALGQYMVRRELDTMVGCASVGLGDGGQLAAALWQTLRHTHLAAPEWQVHPRNPLPIRSADDTAAIERVPMRAMPPLIKGYLRGGARVLGPPCHDRQFHTADLPIMMRMQELAPRYRAQFLVP